jgi:DNA-binding transcriptional regulator YhcF (GntR family)
MGCGSRHPRQLSAMTITPRRRRTELSETLRRRILSAISAGTLRHGDRLPSARELAAEFDADPRLVLGAYRALASEGIVDIRQRSGIYVMASPAVAGGPAIVAEGWVVDVLEQGIAREIPAPRLGDWLTRCVNTRRLRAAVVAATADQLDGLGRELRGDYGLHTSLFYPEQLLGDDGLAPAELLAADIVVTTAAPAPAVRRALDTAHGRIIVIGVRPDLVGNEWQLLLREPVYVVLSDERFVPILDAFFTDVPGAENIRPIILGRDELASIPPDAPVYVTRSAREQLGSASVPGRVVPPARILATESAREILAAIVAANIRAMESD